MQNPHDTIRSEPQETAHAINDENAPNPRAVIGSNSSLEAAVTEYVTGVRKSIAEAAAANLKTGPLVMRCRALEAAIMDDRLERGHLRVLVQVTKRMNGNTAKAWPGRTAIASRLDLAPKSVSNRLRELNDSGYLIAEKEFVPGAGRNLTVYTLDHDAINQRTDEESPCPPGLPKSLPAGTSPAKGPAGRAQTSLPAGDSNLLNGTTPSGAGASGAGAPSVRLEASIWGDGLAWLKGVYGGAADERSLRSRLGKLAKDYGKDQVVVALLAAQRESPIDPLEWMTAYMVRKGQGKPARHQSPTCDPARTAEFDAMWAEVRREDSQRTRH